MIIVLDASAWFAYFQGTAQGETVRAYLERADEAITPASVVAEVAEAARLRKENPSDYLAFIESKSTVLPITGELAIRAGRILAQAMGRKMRVRDAVVVASAQVTGGRILSINPGMEGLEDIVPL